MSALGHSRHFRQWKVSASPQERTTPAPALPLRASRQRRSIRLLRRGGSWHETSPPHILASRSRRRRAADSFADRTGARLSHAAGADHRWLSGRGGSDIIARLLGQWLTERLGQSFIIEN